MKNIYFQRTSKRSEKYKQYIENSTKLVLFQIYKISLHFLLHVCFKFDFLPRSGKNIFYPSDGLNDLRSRKKKENESKLVIFRKFRKWILFFQKIIPVPLQMYDVTLVFLRNVSDSIFLLKCKIYLNF